MSNIPHVTVVHIHSADPTTPAMMLKALPKLPPVLNYTLKLFYNTEAAKGAGHPWWFDLGIVKSGDGFENMMAFNTRCFCGANAAARWSSAALHRPRLCGDERCSKGTGQDNGGQWR